MERLGCEAGEEACDVCTKRHWETMAETELVAKEEEEEEDRRERRKIEWRFTTEEQEGRNHGA